MHRCCLDCMCVQSPFLRLFLQTNQKKEVITRLLELDPAAIMRNSRINSLPFVLGTLGQCSCILYELFHSCIKSKHAIPWFELLLQTALLRMRKCLGRLQCLAGGRVGNNNQNVRNSTSALIVGNATATAQLAQKAQAAHVISVSHISLITT